MAANGTSMAALMAQNQPKARQYCRRVPPSRKIR
jgi:hypothetical protein